MGGRGQDKAERAPVNLASVLAAHQDRLQDAVNKKASVKRNNFVVGADGENLLRLFVKLVYKVRGRGASRGLDCLSSGKRDFNLVVLHIIKLL